MERLRDVEPAELPAAELAILEQLATEFKTPSVVAQLRSLCAAQRKATRSVSNALEEKIAKRVAEQDAQEEVAFGNELEKTRTEWADAKSMAQAAATSVGAKAPGKRGRAKK